MIPSPKQLVTFLLGFMIHGISTVSSQDRVDSGIWKTVREQKATTEILYKQIVTTEDWSNYYSDLGIEVELYIDKNDVSESTFKEHFSVFESLEDPRSKFIWLSLTGFFLFGDHDEDSIYKKLATQFRRQSIQFFCQNPERAIDLNWFYVWSHYNKYETLDRLLCPHGVFGETDRLKSNVKELDFNQEVLDSDEFWNLAHSVMLLTITTDQMDLLKRFENIEQTPTQLKDIIGEINRRNLETPILFLIVDRSEMKLTNQVVALPSYCLGAGIGITRLLLKDQISLQQASEYFETKLDFDSQLRVVAENGKIPPVRDWRDDDLIPSRRVVDDCFSPKNR